MPKFGNEANARQITAQNTAWVPCFSCPKGLMYKTSYGVCALPEKRVSVLKCLGTAMSASEPSQSSTPTIQLKAFLCETHSLNAFSEPKVHTEQIAWQSRSGICGERRNGILQFFFAVVDATNSVREARARYTAPAAHSGEHEGNRINLDPKGGVYSLRSHVGFDKEKRKGWREEQKALLE
jgi:hypothetical protein